MLDAYLAENEQEFKLVQAIHDNLSSNDQMLSFKKDDIIRLVTDSTISCPAGFLFGTLKGKQGLFPHDTVRSLSIEEFTARSSGVEKLYKPYINEMLPVMNNSSTTNSSNKSVNYQDGNFSMMEFAMVHFKQSIEKLVIVDKSRWSNKPREKAIESNCVLEKLKNLKIKNGNEREWTWSEYAEMVKFVNVPIHTSLLKFQNNDFTQLAVSCFIDIMRYMGDYPLAKAQKEIDCVYFLLQTLHHHR